MTRQCYHCAQPIPEGLDCQTTLNNEVAYFCCYGCLAVAQTILGHGLSAYYQFRQGNHQTSELISQERIEKLRVYDSPAFQKQFVYFTPDKSYYETHLVIQGLHCPACVWLIEKRLIRLNGLDSVTVNLTTGRASIRWQQDIMPLSKIVEAILHLGYQATPDMQQQQAKLFKQQKNEALTRVGLSGLFMMQVMMLSVGLYLGVEMDMIKAHQTFIRWCCLALTFPVLWLCGRPFFKSAWIALWHRQLNMDVPVVTALTICFVASIWFTLTGGEDVYYDAICMFVFFLSLSRFIDLNARYKLSAPFFAFQSLTPQWATRCVEQQYETVATHDVQPGDRLLVKPGETIPADGCIVKGETSVSESMLTGESCPKYKQPGDSVYTGSQNIEQAIILKVQASGLNTLLSQMIRLLSTAQSQKSKMVERANDIAQWFIAAVLGITLITCVVGWFNQLDNLLPTVIAMLVVTCPCALSLAIPTVVTCGTYRLMRQGILVVNNHLLHGLTQITDVVFDKTGTLTTGQLSVTHYECLTQSATVDVKQVAYTLEQNSEHPIAKAIVSYCEPFVNTPLSVQRVKLYANQGVEATIDSKTYRLGRLSFVQAQWQDTSSCDEQTQAQFSYLGDEKQLLAKFQTSDQVRENASELIEYLHSKGLCVHLLSGDPSSAPRQIGQQLNIKHVTANASIEEKLAYVNHLISQSKKVLMVGDGVNDAAVLKRAHVSIAVQSATELAKMNADGILVSNNLNDIRRACQIAQKAQFIMSQNITWAIVYNVFALPLAMLGWVTPYWAALGMSVSSLCVVVNATRLK